MGGVRALDGSASDSAGQPGLTPGTTQVGRTPGLQQTAISLLEGEVNARRLLTLALLTFSLGACASRPKSEGPSVDRNLITREQLAQRPSDNMHGVISVVRPDWLRPPTGAASFGSGAARPTVYLDGRPLGDVDLLRSFSAESVERARYYIVTEAQSKFGMMATTPVIELISRGR